MLIENIIPSEIEKKSMNIIDSELGDVSYLSNPEKAVLKRVIHTTADFDYVTNLKFSDGAVETAIEAIKRGATIVTDTNMALSGINKSAAKALGCELHCFMSDSDIATKAREDGVTRAVASMEKAAELFSERNLIFAIGNAPTSLIRIYELIIEGKIKPSLVIGLPVGFVNVVRCKELIMTSDVPFIVGVGRKGGSTVAAAVCNSLLYQIYDRGE